MERNAAVWAVASAYFGRTHYHLRDGQRRRKWEKGNPHTLLLQLLRNRVMIAGAFTLSYVRPAITLYQ
jgi:hypothetical protein